MGFDKLKGELVRIGVRSRDEKAVIEAQERAAESRKQEIIWEQQELAQNQSRKSEGSRSSSSSPSSSEEAAEHLGPPPMEPAPVPDQVPAPVPKVNHASGAGDEAEVDNVYEGELNDGWPPAGAVSLSSLGTSGESEVGEDNDGSVKKVTAEYEKLV